jgi:DNA-binding protein Fis
MLGARWCLGRGAASRFDGFKLEARSLREAVMPEVLRQNAPPVANDFLRSAGLTPDEIDLVRKLVGHTIAAVECGLICETLAWRGGNRTHAANVLGISIRALRNKIHLYKHMGIGLSEPSSGRGGATAACPQTDYCSNRNSPAYSPRTRLF